MARNRRISLLITQEEFDACKLYGDGIASLGAKKLMEDGITAKSKREEVLDSLLEKLLDRIDLIGDVTAAMRAEQLVLYNLLEQSASLSVDFDTENGE